MTKQTWIIILLIAVAIGGFIWYNKNQKTDLATAKPSDSFDMDDTALYNRLIEIFKAESTLPSNLDWINPLVLKRFKSSPTKTGNGRNSKAETFYTEVSAVNRNETGRFVDESGAKALYPKSMRDTMWAAMSDFRAKYSTL